MPSEQELLSKTRDAIGQQNYNDAVNNVGKDGLILATLMAAVEHQVEARRKRKRAWRWGVLIVTGIVSLALTPVTNGGSFGIWATIAILWPAAEEKGWAAVGQTILGGAAVVIVIALLSWLIPELWLCIVAWWEWLGGHFGLA